MGEAPIFIPPDQALALLERLAAQHGLRLAALTTTAEPIQPAPAEEPKPKAEAASGGETAAEVFTRYQKEVTPDHRAWEREERMIKQFLREEPAAIAATRVVDLTDEFIEFAARKAKEWEPDTLNRRLALYASSLNHARKAKLEGGWGIAMPKNEKGEAFNPAAIVKRPKNNPPREARLTPEQVDTFCAAAKDVGGVWAAKLPLIIRLCCEINLRREELSLMKPADVRLDRNELLLRITKNGEPRRVPLTSRAKATLTEALATVASTTQVFPMSGVGALSKAYDKARAHAAKTDPSLASFRLHDTRHQSLSQMAAKIPNAAVLMKASGHKDIRSLLRYVNPTSGELAKMLE